MGLVYAKADAIIEKYGGRSLSNPGLSETLCRRRDLAAGHQALQASDRICLIRDLGYRSCDVAWRLRRRHDAVHRLGLTIWRRARCERLESVGNRGLRRMTNVMESPQAITATAGVVLTKLFGFAWRHRNREG